MVSGHLPAGDYQHEGFDLRSLYAGGIKGAADRDGADRALGKAETPIKVTTSQESMDEAEAQLMAMVHEFQIEDELKEAAQEES